MKRWIIRKYARLRGKILRENATPEYIARGWALGMFCGCLIPFGLQLMISLPLAFLLRCSKIGATVGTLLTNHFTIFIIYPIQCFVGNWIIRGNLTYGKIVGEMHSMIRISEHDGMVAGFRKLLELGWEFAVPFFVGGALLTAVMTPITYIFVINLVRKYRDRRGKRSAGTA
ncbi:MAG: DUF2062 domain-containing protein [Victivallaceae bacterium]|nr:DUF2062 domain-containing protein [Victivallaceae bacterium]